VATGGYIVPTHHALRWIEYLPEVGNPILDEVKWIYAAEEILAVRKADLLADVRRTWARDEIRRAKTLAKDRPGTNPTPSELRAVASPNRVGTEG
jgi:hypothetical protein